MISLFRVLTDNYGILLYDEQSAQAAAIDAPDGEEIARYCARHGLHLTHIFNTHHHSDHVGGNLFLKEKYGLTIIGPKAEAARIPGIDRALEDGAQFTFGNKTIHFMHTPGHTLGHGVYYVPDEKSVFVGDTLFILGCGRLFEGTAKQMYDSLHRLAGLPAETKIYCAHEYTLANGQFALHLDPENAALVQAMESYRLKQKNGQPTVPGTIGRELKTNPFLRARSIEDFAKIRQAKDNF